MQQSWIGGGMRFSYCTEHDLPDISRMLSKESVCRWLFFGPNTDEATRSYFLPLIGEMWAALAEGRMPDHHVFTARLEDAGDFVGQCALLPVDFNPGSFLIGYQLDDIYWKRGYGTLACTFLVYFAFIVLEGYRLNGDTVAGNSLVFGLLASDLAPERLSGLGETFAAEHSAAP